MIQFRIMNKAICLPHHHHYAPVYKNLKLKKADDLAQNSITFDGQFLEIQNTHFKIDIVLLDIFVDLKESSKM